MNEGILDCLSLEVVHLSDAFIAVFHHKLQSILVQLLQQGEYRAQNILITPVWVIPTSGCRTLVIRSLLFLVANRGLLCGSTALQIISSLLLMVLILRGWMHLLVLLLHIDLMLLIVLVLLLDLGG